MVAPRMQAVIERIEGAKAHPSTCDAHASMPAIVKTLECSVVEENDA